MSKLSSPLRFIKIGFWLGLGLLIPLVGAQLARSGVEALLFDSIIKDKLEASVRSAAAGAAQTEYVRVTAFKEYSDEVDTVLRGTVRNSGTEAVASFSINVEFFDDKNQFLTECTETIAARVAPKESENFVVRCRLNPQDPKHSAITVRVVSTSIF